MTLNAFKSSLQEVKPPHGISKLLEAMWYDKKDDWTRAHDIAQDVSSADGSWIHAYLHRKEGDHGNAAYWYRRAGRPMAESSLDDEWEEIVESLLAMNA